MRKLNELSRMPVEHQFGGTPVLSPDGKTLLLPTHEQGGMLQVWDVSADQPQQVRRLMIPGAKDGFALQFLPDNRTVAFGSGNGLLRLLDAEKERFAKLLDLLPGPVRAIVASADGRYLITGNGNGTIYVLRLAPPQHAPGQ
jgi:WD40 repeat protein